MSLSVLHRDTPNRTSVSTRACGKINLTLEVLGKRSDGYHDIHSLAIGVDLADRLSCTLLPEQEIRIRCERAELATPENLVYRAAKSFLKATGIEAGFEIELEKEIPVGGGMGGGSSDAAAALQLFNEVCDAGLSHASLAAIGATLGSDVPLFLQLPSVVMRGRGELVEPVSMKWSGCVLLVHVDAFVSTPLVYQKWRNDAQPRRPSSNSKSILEGTSADMLNGFLRNDLEEAVFDVAPDVAQVFRALEALRVGPFRVSGAGSTLFRLFDDEDAAGEIARSIENAKLNVKTRIVAAPVGENPLVFEEN